MNAEMMPDSSNYDDFGKALFLLYLVLVFARFCLFCYWANDDETTDKYQQPTWLHIYIGGPVVWVLIIFLFIHDNMPKLRK